MLAGTRHQDMLQELQHGLPTSKLPEWGGRKDVWGPGGATNGRPASSSCSQVGSGSFADLHTTKLVQSS